MVFNDHLYIITGTMAGACSFGDPNCFGPGGIEVWESSTGDHRSWTQVNIDGFGTKYAGCTYSGKEFCNFPIHHMVGGVAVYKAPGEAQEHLYIGTKSHFGAEVWRYNGNGIGGWENVTPPMVGTQPPYRFNSMEVFQDTLYLAEGFPTANLRKFDGNSWTVEVPGPEPFHQGYDRLESLAVLNNKLFVSAGGNPGTLGDQVWGYLFSSNAPVAVCKDVTVKAMADCTASASIDGGSYDPDGGPVTLIQMPGGGQYGLEPFELGTTSVTLTVIGSTGLTATCTGSVTVVDSTAPTIMQVTQSRTTLWPPNHQMLPATFAVSAADNCDPNPYCRITTVTCNEVQFERPDWMITGDLSVLLRAERSGNVANRVYTVTITCGDNAGNNSIKKATVLVPHSNR